MVLIKNYPYLPIFLVILRIALHFAGYLKPVRLRRRLNVNDHVPLVL